MGLDITGYSDVKQVSTIHFDEDGEPLSENGEALDASHAYMNPYFKKHTAPFKGSFYFDYGGEFGFRAGSYRGYNQWRDHLAQLASYKAEPCPYHQNDERFDYGASLVKDGAFHELINFSDCEGYIGTDFCQKLLKDFEDFDEAASVFISDGGYFYSVYKAFHTAFRLGAQDGLVSFH